MWSLLNSTEQVDILLHSSTNLNFDCNAAIFSEVRLYISHSLASLVFTCLFVHCLSFLVVLACIIIL